MIWLTWRQHRRPALYVLLLFVALAALMIPTGRSMYAYAGSSGLADCINGLGTGQFIPFDAMRGCEDAGRTFENRYAALLNPAILLLLVPALVGMFFGAPLVAREIEQGTHRLVWTQGVSRTRWALVKFGLILLAAVVLSAGYAALTSWWFGPLLAYTRTGRFELPAFDVYGVAPVGYTLFAVALGIFAGTVTRKALPAMAITLVGYTVVRAVVANFARPAYQTPEELKFPVASGQFPNEWRGDWVFDRAVYDSSGGLVARDSMRLCPENVTSCDGNGQYNVLSFHPAERFWLFQYIETGIFVALAAVLLYLALRRVRRRIS